MARPINRHIAALRQAGYFRELDEFLRQVREVRPTTLDFITASASNLARFQHHDAAIEISEEAVRLHPESNDARHGLMLSYLRAEKYKQAIAIIQEWQQSNMDVERATSDLALCYLCAGRAEEAVGIAKKQHDLNPKKAAYSRILAGAHLRRRDFDSFREVLPSSQGRIFVMYSAIASYFSNDIVAAKTLLEGSDDLRLFGAANILRLTICNEPLAERALKASIRENYGEEQFPFILKTAERLKRDIDYIFELSLACPFDAIDRNAPVPVFSGPIRPADFRESDEQPLPVFLKAVPPKAQR